MKLHPYQQRAIDFIKSQSRAILSIDMGLGKTAIILHYLNEINPSSAVIVAPKLVSETVWLQEAQKWGLLIAQRMCVVSGRKSTRERLLESPEKPIKIISCENLNDFSNIKTQVLVIDELTRFKTINSNRSKLIQQINASQYIGLTGTFTSNGAIDIFGQTTALRITKVRYMQNGNYKWFPEFEAWRAQYFRNVMAGSGQSFEKWERMVDLDVILKPFKKHIFTLIADDYLNIPPVSYIQHNVKLSESEVDNYMSLSAMLRVKLNDDTYLSFREEGKFSKLQTMCNGFVYDRDGIAQRSSHSSKITAVANFVQRCAAENERVLLFYAFREEAIWLSEYLASRGVRYCSFRDKQWKQKWDNHEIDVLMGHPASCGHGIDGLQNNGRIIVWSSITFSFEFWAQANARLARQGQKRPVQVHTFAAIDTIEALQFKAVTKKVQENETFKMLTK